MHRCPVRCRRLRRCWRHGRGIGRSSGRLSAACPTICRRCSSKRGRRPPRRSLCCGASRICGVTAKERRRHRSIARTIAAIEQFDGLASVSADAWAAATGDDKEARAANKNWRQIPKLESHSQEELNDLVDYAISPPGVVLGGALRRHGPSSLDAGWFAALVHLWCQGVRAYLPTPAILRCDE